MKKLILVFTLMASAAYGEIYTWKDAKGTTHYANSTYDIPAKYKGRVKVLNLGLEPKGENQASQGAAPAPAPAPVPAVPPAAAVTQPPPQQQVAPAAARPAPREERRRGRRSHPLESEE